jgi:hypothetical protein
MADIFVSYAREDAERARLLAERFDREGWSVFWDRFIRAGEAWEQELRTQLDRAACIVVLWSESSVSSPWVYEEAMAGRKRGALIPGRLASVVPPQPFDDTQARDLTAWTDEADSSDLVQFVDDVALYLGHRRGVSVVPTALYVVIGRPLRHPDLGATINMTCKWTNKLDRDAIVSGLTATASGPHDLSYDFDWRLPYDVTHDGRDHRKRVEAQTHLTIAAGGVLTRGIQLRAASFTDVVDWPAGTYTFKVRGWVNRARRDTLPNLKCDIEAGLPDVAAREIEKHRQLSDEDWVARQYSDDAYGVPFVLTRVRPLLAAT